jgi:hypothetical protein
MSCSRRWGLNASTFSGSPSIPTPRSRTPCRTECRPRTRLRSRRCVRRCLSDELGPMRRTGGGTSPNKPRRPVGVRNSDQELDLRLRNATAQTCQHLSRRHGREHPAFGCLALGRGMRSSRAGPECVRLRLHPHSVPGRCPVRASRGRDWPVSGRRSARAKPQVTGVGDRSF